MFTVYQDYNIIHNDTPVLTRQEKGQFEFKNCYFLEFVVKADDETLNKINTVCKPFDYKIAIRHAISKYNIFSNHTQRLFLLVGPDTIRNEFKETDDFLALAFCTDGPQSTVIQYFEVNYKFRHSYEPNQKYRQVGTSAVNELKKIYQTRELCGKSAFHALEFWFKNGFTRIDDHELYVHWRQK